MPPAQERTGGSYLIKTAYSYLLHPEHFERLFRRTNSCARGQRTQTCVRHCINSGFDNGSNQTAKKHAAGNIIFQLASSTF
jgi:hypothetical protein